MSIERVVKRLSKIEDYLKEIRLWIKFSALRELREMLLKELDSNEKMIIYELTDGKRSQQDIGMQVGISRRTVSYYWQKWQGMGIVVPSEQRKRRMRKIISLSEAGITVPSMKQIKEPKAEFKPKDLRRILDDRTIFPDMQEIVYLATNVLSLRFQLPITRDALLDKIVKAFWLSDRRRQALFMQALERRAFEKKDTKFRRYFESWEQQIKG